MTEAELLAHACLASSQESPDAIDLVISERMGLASHELDRYEVKDFVPFDPVKKRASATVWDKKEKIEFEVVKGAPQIVVEYCLLPRKEGEEVMQMVQLFAQKGLRGLGVARKRKGERFLAYFVCFSKEFFPKGEDWKFVGMLAMIDALRPEAPAVVHELAELGVEVKMVTGDGLDIARETCHLLGMFTHTIARPEVC